MNALLPIACGLALLPAADLIPTYEAGQKLTTSVQVLTTSETTESEFLRDGEPMEGRGFGGGLNERSLRFVQRDEVLEAADGQPTKVRREYADLAREAVTTFGESDRSIESSSPFEGVVLVLTADEEGELAVEVEEGETPDAERLEALPLRCLLDALLPEGEVELDAAWELSEAAIRGILLEDLAEALFEAPEPEEGGWVAGSGGARPGGVPRSQILGAADWEGSARFARIEEDEAGVRIAVIELELEAQGDMPERQGGFGGRRGGGALGALEIVDNTYEHELAGELHYALDERIPIALELEGSMVWRTERSFERNGSTMEMRSTREGTLEITITVEPTQ